MRIQSLGPCRPCSYYSSNGPGPLHSKLACLESSTYNYLHQHNEFKISFALQRTKHPHTEVHSTMLSRVLLKRKPIPFIICNTETQYVPNYEPNQLLPQHLPSGILKMKTLWVAAKLKSNLQFLLDEPQLIVGALISHYFYVYFDIPL